MSSDVTVYVTIGRDVGGKPMPAQSWADFQLDVRGTLQSADLDIVTEAYGIGRWGDVVEDCHIVVAVGPLGPLDGGLLVARLYDQLGMLAERYQQEAIALSVTTTAFVTAGAGAEART